jgi:hypothetical protein
MSASHSKEFSAFKAHVNTPVLAYRVVFTLEVLDSDTITTRLQTTYRKPKLKL